MYTTRYNKGMNTYNIIAEGTEYQIRRAEMPETLPSITTAESTPAQKRRVSPRKIKLTQKNMNAPKEPTTCLLQIFANTWSKDFAKLPRAEQAAYFHKFTVDLEQRNNQFNSQVVPQNFIFDEK